MIDGKRLLDALVGAVSQAKPGATGQGQSRGGFGDLLQQVLGSGSAAGPTCVPEAGIFGTPLAPEPVAPVPDCASWKAL